MRVKDKNILRSIDIFGVPIHINFNYKNKHTTKLGGFITLVLFGVLLTFFISLILNIINKENPQVLQEDLIVQSPSRFDLNTKNFGFAFAILDQNYEPFIDESIYKVNALFMYKKEEKQLDGSVVYPLVQKDIKMGPCTKESFQIQGLENYFLQLNYNQLYCIYDINDLYLEGQFEQNQFSTIEIFISKCIGVECQNPEKINRVLKNQQLQVYYSNKVIKISNTKDPFQPIGLGQYWNVNLNAEQAISFMFQTAYVKDDIGLIGQDFQIQKSLVFSSYKTLQGTDTEKNFFRLSLYLEKNKEVLYQRSFMKLTQAISQIGGIYNVLFFIGCLLAQPYSSMELKRKLVNSTFSFPQEDKHNKHQNQHKDEPLITCNEPIVTVNEHLTTGNDPIQSKNQFLLKSSFKEQKTNCQYCNLSPNKEFKRNCTHSGILSLSKPEFLIESIPDINNYETKFNKNDQNENNKINLKENNTITQNTFIEQSENIEKKGLKKSFLINKITKGLSKVQELTIKSREYFFYYFKCLKSTDLQNILYFGTDKISEFTDITYIVNKLLEFEKLKHLLLNEQQLKLFEYIPKPQITKEAIEQIHKDNLLLNLTKIKKSNKLFHSMNSQKSDSTKINDKSSPQKIQEVKQNGFNVLNLMNRSLIEKEQQAKEAYYQIYKNQQQHSKVDIKLLQLLDQNVIQQLTKNLEDRALLSEITLFNHKNPRQILKDLKFQSNANLIESMRKKSVLYEIASTSHCLKESRQQETIQNQNPENFNLQNIEEVQDTPIQFSKLGKYGYLNGSSKQMRLINSVQQENK